MSTTINNTIICNEAHASLDSYYGPYKSLREALETLTSTKVNGVDYNKRSVGLTVGIINKDKITEYWFQGGTDDNNLVMKNNESALPQGLKIVTFDKNGGTGVQNSIITDTEGNVCLPECTLSHTNGKFSKWSYGGNQYDPGNAIQIGDNTQVTAIWTTTKKTYTVSWVNPDGGTISCTCNSERMTNPQTCNEGSTIICNITIEKGYELTKWTGLPEGVVPSGDRVEFELSSDVTIGAELNKQGKSYTIIWSKDRYPDGIEDIIPNGGIESGKSYPEGTLIALKVIFSEEDIYKTVEWIDEETGKPVSSDNPYEFKLTKDTTLYPKAQKAAENNEDGKDEGGLISDGE